MCKFVTRVVYALATLSTLLAGLAIAVPVVPGAAGYGIETPAGRGNGTTPTVYIVNTLQDVVSSSDGLTSFREAVNASGPRYILFAVSGVIQLTTDVTIRNPFVTIAGQTAPAPGITLKGAPLRVMSHDVLVQHIAIRPGPGCPVERCHNWDAANLNTDSAQDTYNVVFDHVSTSWSIDGMLDVAVGNSANGNVRDVTIRNSLMAEPLYDPSAPVDDSDPQDPYRGPLDGLGSLVSVNVQRVAFLNNVMALQRSRSPLVKDSAEDVVIVNNLIYAPETASSSKIAFGNHLRARTEGNVIVLRPGGSTQSIYFYNGITVPQGQVANYLSNNRAVRPETETWYPTDNDPWSTSIVRVPTDRTVDSVRSLTDQTAPIAGLAPLTTDIPRRVLDGAGARPAIRDDVDGRIAGYIDTCVSALETAAVEGVSCNQAFPALPSDVGGYPSGSSTHSLTLPSNAHVDSDGDGYTNIEEWLHSLAAQVEGDTLDPATSLLDDFNDGNANGWDHYTAGNWSVVNGGTSMVLQQTWMDGTTRSVMQGTNWEDQTVQADVKVVALNDSAAWFGLMARYQDIQNHYYLVVSNAGLVRLSRMAGGSWTALASATLPGGIAAGGHYRIRLEAIGNTLRAYVNDQFVLDAVDTSGAPFTSGRTGIMMYKTSAQYDNVRVSPTARTTLLEDDFEDGAADGWTESGASSSWSVALDGTTRVYRQTSTTSDARSAAGSSGWNDQVIDAEVTPLAYGYAESWFGLMVRYQDPTSYYYLVVRADGTVRIAKIVSNSYTFLVSGSVAAPVVNTKYKLRLEAVGTALKAFINGQLILETNDATFASGSAGVMMWRTSAQVDNVKVTRP